MNDMNYKIIITITFAANYIIKKYNARNNFYSSIAFLAKQELQTK